MLGAGPYNNRTVAIISETNSKIEYLDQEEGRVLLDEQARRCLGISGEEFLRRYDAGAYAADPDRPEILEVAFLIPFAR